MTTEPVFKKGHEFHGPDGQGYRLTRDVYPWDIMTCSSVESFGGAPIPVAGQNAPEWFAKAIAKDWTS